MVVSGDWKREWSLPIRNTGGRSDFKAAGIVGRSKACALYPRKEIITKFRKLMDLTKKKKY